MYSGKRNFMHKLTLSLATAGLLLAPVEATAAQYEVTDVRPGTFAGARFQIAFGGKQASKPRVALAIAPTMTRISDGAGVHTSIGEGVALNFGRKPTLTLAGMRADQAFGLAPSKEVNAEHKLSVSTGGWIAIGIGAVAVAGGLYFVHLMDVAKDNSD
jgi:hypothetical protein